MTDTNQPTPLPTLRPGDSHAESLIEPATQGHASTREAMRWLVRQLVPATQPAGVPDGYVLVPIEPTPAMLVALWDHRDSMLGQSENRIAKAGYARMLTAAQAQKGQP